MKLGEVFFATCMCMVVLSCRHFNVCAKGMIISDRYKLIFVRVPKTASTSVEKLLFDVDPDCIRSCHNHYPHGHYRLSEIERAMSPASESSQLWFTRGEDDVYGHLPARYAYDEYLKFGFVRHPLSWLTSMITDLSEYDFSNIDDIHWVLDSNRKLPRSLPGEISFMQGYAGMVLSQFYFWNWNNGADELHTQSAYLDRAVDFIGYYEHLKYDLREVLGRVGISTRHILPRLNVTHTGINKPRLDPRLVEWAKIFYARDFERFYPE